MISPARDLEGIAGPQFRRIFTSACAMLRKGRSCERCGGGAQLAEFSDDESEGDTI
jgi:hypothetical protein